MMPLMPSTLIAPAASAPEVHITYTGGTIGMVESPHGLIPGADLDSWLAELLEGTALAGRVSLTVLDPLIDSANATPESWQAIIDDLRAHRAATPADGTDGINGADGVKSYVVLHGTDTMAYTSAALSYALTDFDRPVVVTGAQLPLSAIGSDAASNVTGALNAATSGRADGVSLFFGHHLLAGNRATKTSSWAFEGFASPGAALPGYRGIGEEQLAAIAEGFFNAVLHDRELAALRRLFIVSQYRDPQIGRRLRHYWIEQPLAFQAGVFAGLINSGDFRDGLDPMATALAFFGPVLALLQLAESGDGAEERARALLRSHVRHFRTTHLHRTAGAEQEAGKAEQTAGAEQETGEAEQAAETEQEAGKAKQEAGTEQAAPVEPSATAGEEAEP